MTPPDLDLVIVGGGPAGVSTALFLAARAPELAERIVILEKERFPREKICAGAIGARADRALSSIGVEVRAPSVEVSGLSIVGENGHLLASLDRPIGRVVRRIEFDAALAAEARARGIRIDEGVRVTGLERDRGGVRLSTSRGEVRARAVVGANGVGSFVRRAIGAPRGRFTAQVVEVDTRPRDVDPDPELLHFDVTDRSLVGYAWDFPTIVRGERLVCRGIYELRDDEGAPVPDGPVTMGPQAAPNPGPLRGPDVGERLAKRLRAQGATPIGKVKRFAERGLSLHEPVASPHVLLVGEAAGIDPVLGEGIAQAILYGAAAGPYLAERLGRRETSFADWPERLRTSRVGLDLRVRSFLAELAYGPRRSVMDRWVTHSQGLAIAGMHYFAGDRVPRTALARAGLDLARSFATR